MIKLFGKNSKKNKNAGFTRDDQRKMLCAQSPFIVKEAYNSIRTNLLFSQQGEKCPRFHNNKPHCQ